MAASGKGRSSVKKAAAKLVRQLPESASWDDLMDEILVRQKIEAGLADLQAGRKVDHAAVRKEYGWP
jgi:predicted transcriptional regulator